LEQDPNLDRAIIAKAMIHLRERQFEQALAAAQRLQAVSPNSPQAHVLIGISQGALRDVEAATRSFEQALALSPGVPDAALNLAAIKASQSDMAGARALYDQVLETNPDHLLTLLRLAELERRLGRPAEQLSVLEHAVASHSDSTPARITLGRAYIVQRMPQKALGTTAGLLETAPDNPAVLEVVGEAQLRVGNTDEALDTFRRLVAAQPDNAGSHFRLARAYDAAREFDKADIELWKTLSLDPEHVQAKIARARLSVRRGDLDIAQSLVEDIKLSTPEEPAILDLEARIALRQNRPGAAVKLLQSALDKRDDSNLVILLSQAQARAEGVEQAIVSLRDWLDRFPGDLRVRNILAQTYLSLERFGEAATEYQSILTNAPDNVAVLNNLAWIKWRTGSTPEGLIFARRAHELAPENGGVMDTLGIILIELGDIEEALPLLRNAHNRLPKNGEIQLHLAQALIESGEIDEARRKLKELLAPEREFAQRAEAEDLLRRLR
jgi:putative PEP-CTERM system TPR-repeat lipoprotein